MMNIYKSLIVSFSFMLFGVGNIAWAANTHTLSDVQSHNSTTDCWVVYSSKVYNITDYLRTHDTKYYFIDSWCGTDMTQAYNTKDNQGVDHKTSTTSGILPAYYIGDLVTVTSTPASTTTGAITQVPTSTPITQIQPSSTNKAVVVNPYDFWTPFFIVNILLWGNYFISKTSFWKSKFKPLTYNMIWNSMLIVSLIPSVVFGLFMILSYSFPELRKINFDFMYWHVEGSICFAVIVLAHLILRLKMYFMQIKTSFSRS